MSGAPIVEGEVILSNELVRVSVRPERGGRIASLESRVDGREWLVQPRAVELGARPAYGSTFTGTDHCGWDEMFPTVDACAYPAAPFLGDPVPDHGELWTLDWECEEQTATSIDMRVRSDRFGYTFGRTLRLDGPTLRCEYTCDVSGATALLWALHPQFSMLEGTRLTLAGKHESMLDTSEPGSPHEVAWGGDLVVERDVEPGADRMLYLHPGELVDGATLADPSGSSLEMRWDVSFARYLGIWADYGRYTEGRVIAVEPTNGFFDDLGRAYRNERVTIFTPDEHASWWVEVSVERR